MSVLRKYLALNLKAAGDRRASADRLFVPGPDLDGDAYAPRAFPEAAVVVGRNHNLIRGGDLPPFGIARIRDRDNHYSAEIEFLDTDRGREDRSLSMSRNERSGG